LGIILTGKCTRMFTVEESWIPVINVIVGLIFVLCFVRGWRHGFVRMIISLIGTIASLYGAWVLAPIVQKQIELWPKTWTPMNDSVLSGMIYPVFNQIAWFFLLFLIFKLIFFVLDKIFKLLQKVPVFKQIMEILGGLIGIIEAFIWCMILSLILCTPLFTNGQDAINESILSTIQNTHNTIITTVLKPIYDTEDTLKLITDASNAAKEQQDLINSLMQNSGQ